MALKLNIRPDIEQEMERLLPKAQVHSKTDYINRAIAAFNKQLNRQLELKRLRSYFHHYQDEAKDVLSEFANLRTHAD